MTKMWTVAALGAVLLGGCSSQDDRGRKIEPSGSGTTRSYAVADFDAVDLSGADDVDIRVGPAFSVWAEGPAEELDKLRIARDGEDLAVGREHKSGVNWNGNEKVKVFVSLPRLTAVQLLGSGDMTVDRIDGDDFKATIAGSGSLAVAALATRSTAVNIAGTGDAKLAGDAGALKVDIAGAGSLEGAGLRGSSANVQIAGSGAVTARIKGGAKVTILGSGDVDLGPEAQCKTTKAGSGSVRCGG